MNFLRTHLNLIIGILLLIVIAGGLYYYLGAANQNSATVLTATPAASGTAGSDLLVALGNLQNVKLNDAIFSNPEFQSLIDFSVSIPAQPVGRVDPFAPLGQSASVGAASLPSNITSGTKAK